MDFTVEDDLALKPYEEALQEIEETLAKVKQNVEGKTGSTADMARLIDMKINMRKHLEAKNIKEIEVTWVDPEFVNEQ